MTALSLAQRAECPVCGTDHTDDLILDQDGCTEEVACDCGAVLRVEKHVAYDVELVLKGSPNEKAAE